MSVPDDLRAVLEQCLSEEASTENLDLYLPTVRQIITNLLQGLRAKQSIYRRKVSDHRHKSSEQSAGSGSERESRSRPSKRDGERGHRSQLSRTAGDNDRPAERDSISRRSALSSSSRRRDPPPQTTTPPAASNEDEPFVGGFAPSLRNGVTSPSVRSERSSASRRRPQSPAPPPSHPPLDFRPSSPHEADVSQTFSAGTAETDQESLPPGPPIPQQQAPAHLKRYSLVDRPVPSSPSPPPSVVVNEPSTPGFNQESTINGNAEATDTATSPPDTPPIDVLQVPAMANSLAALKKSDALERRASKRFSTYNISKMTGASAARERSLRSSPNRRSLAAANAPLTVGELAVLAEEGEDSSEMAVVREGSSRSRSRSNTPNTENPSAPPVPPLPPSVAPSPEPIVPPHTVNGLSNKHVLPPPNEVSQSRSPSSFPVFLQLGREVKKVTLEPGSSFASLRVLFVDKFSYNPGLESFPAIYIRDPSSGVQYELEDMDEVKEKCLLSLSIERSSHPLRSSV
jgi:hypothetical protein